LRQASQARSADEGETWQLQIKIEIWFTVRANVAGLVPPRKAFYCRGGFLLLEL